MTSQRHFGTEADTRTMIQSMKHVDSMNKRTDEAGRWIAQGATEKDFREAVRGGKFSDDEVETAMMENGRMGVT